MEWQSKAVRCDVCVLICVCVCLCVRVDALDACFGPSFPSSSYFLLVSLLLTDADSNLIRANIVKEASRGKKEKGRDKSL